MTNVLEPEYIWQTETYFSQLNIGEPLLWAVSEMEVENE